MPDTKHLLINLILYGLLPLWGVSGFIDWCCHRATHVERTSGIKESALHSLMGVQLGIPILLCLLHDVAAHWDVHYSAPLRRISSIRVVIRARPPF